MKCSPLPRWKIGQYLADDQFPEQQEITDDCGIIHAIACDNETAKQIVRAVNAHEELLEALKTAEAVIAVNRERFPVKQDSTLMKLRAAIAKAEGRP